MGASLAQLVECWTLECKIAGSVLIRSLGERCCVVEQDTLSSLLTTGSTQKKGSDMTEILLTGT